MLSLQQQWFQKPKTLSLQSSQDTKMDKNGVDKFCRPTFSRNLYMRENVASVDECDDMHAIKFHAFVKDRMQIPTEFLDKIEEAVPDTAILRGPFGCSWPVKVRQKENGIFLADGWENFRVHYSLVSVSFLLFTYCGNWCFEVDIFADSGLEKGIVDAGVNKEAGPSSEKNKRGRRGKRSVSSLKDHLPKSSWPGSDIYANSGLEKQIVGAVNKEAGPSAVKNKRGRRGKGSVSSLKDHLPKSCWPGSGVFADSGLEKDIVGAGVNEEAQPSGVKSKRGRPCKRSDSSLKDHLPKSRWPGSDIFADSGLEKEIVGARVNKEAGPSGVKNKRGRRGKRSVSSLKDHLSKSCWPGSGLKYRRITWHPELLSLYLDSCLEEAVKERSASGNLTPESWQKVRSILNKKTNIDFTPMQLLNKWNSLRRSYIVWSEITEAKRGANNINFNQKQQQEYIKMNPLAEDTCKNSLAFPEKMKSLFGCYVSAREDGGDAW